MEKIGRTKIVDLLEAHGYWRYGQCERMGSHP